MPIIPSSTTPIPPGVSGSELITRPIDHARNASLGGTVATETPTARRDSSNTRYAVSWLASVAAVSHPQRRRSRTSRSARSVTRASPLQPGGFRWKSRATQAPARAAVSPSHRAAPGLRRAATVSPTISAPTAALTPAITAVVLDSCPVAKTRIDPTSG